MKSTCTVFFTCSTVTNRCHRCYDNDDFRLGALLPWRIGLLCRLQRWRMGLSVYWSLVRRCRWSIPTVYWSVTHRSADLCNCWQMFWRSLLAVTQTYGSRCMLCAPISMLVYFQIALRHQTIQALVAEVEWTNRHIVDLSPSPMWNLGTASVGPRYMTSYTGRDPLSRVESLCLYCEHAFNSPLSFALLIAIYL